MSQSNYLAIDYGRARIGLAKANSIAKLASPFEIVQNNNDGLDKILTTLGEFDVVVVGSPRDMNGSYSEMYHEVKAWYEEIHNKSLGLGHPADFVLFDETLSSVRAREVARDLGRADTEHIDDLAAAIILQDYLDQTL